MEALITPEELVNVFGPRALDFALFYKHEGALRFELSVGDGYINLFTSAYDRAREILGFLFRESADLVVILSYFQGEGLSVFRSLRDCGLRVPRSRIAWRGRMEGDEDPEGWTYVAFRAPKEMLTPLLWGVLAEELGIRPRLVCNLHLADPARGVLAHPYDDRGMDVIGPNKALLQQLFRRFNSYLLDYDRAQMEEYFGSALDE